LAELANLIEVVEKTCIKGSRKIHATKEKLEAIKKALGLHLKPLKFLELAMGIEPATG
jgi:hypothetical protein